MREQQRELPYLDPDGYSASTPRGLGPLTLSRRMHEALREGVLPVIRSLEAEPRFNADRTYFKYRLSPDGVAQSARYSPHMMPLESRVHLSLRLPMPPVFHNCILLDIVAKRDREMLNQYMKRPHLREEEVRDVGRWLGRNQPIGNQIWLAESGMPTLYLMSGAMENANCGVLLGLIDHLEKHPPANPHEVGLWLKSNPMPGWWAGSRAIEKRLSVLQFRPAPVVAPAVFKGRSEEKFQLPTQAMGG